MNDLPLALTYDDVLLVPKFSKVSSRSQVSLKTKITPNIEINLPLISINMESVTGVKMAIAMSKAGAISFYPRFATSDVQAKEVKKILDAGCRVIPAVGIKDHEMERVEKLVKVGVKAVTIDVAHGHLASAISFLKSIKKKYPKLEVISGVIATYEGACDLFKAGADAVRVGVGPGTICTTREVTGSGVPQISATMDAYKAGLEFNRPVITDGGTKTVGDIVKALAAGANAVVAGSQFAGSDEAPGEVIELGGKKYKRYNASTSAAEKLKQFKKNSKDKNTEYIYYVEGVEAMVNYKGPVKRVLDIMERGIRSGLSYSGAFNIHELHQRAKFIRITPNSVKENGPHGVKVVG
jgi:IMP dehydrogenase